MFFFGMQVNINEAKTNLSRLIRKVLEGEEVTIARSQTPLVKLVKVERKTAKRRIGIHKGKITIAPDFDEPLPDFKDYR